MVLFLLELSETYIVSIRGYRFLYSKNVFIFPSDYEAKAEEDPKLFRTWLFNFRALREKRRQELDPRMSLAREKLSTGKPGCLLGSKAKMSTKALKCCSLSTVI